LLACDGLWDVCTHDEVAKIVHEQFTSGKNPEEIASFLCNEALRKRSEDNVTVILTSINWENSETEENNQIKNENTASTKPEEFQNETKEVTDTTEVTESKVEVDIK